MRSVNKRGVLALSIACALCIASAGCGGSGGGGEDPDDTLAGDQFVPGDGNAGTIQVLVNQDVVPVAGTTGFFVQVRDRNGRPVEDLEISCDTEQGLALVEPTSGREHTDSNGAISGVVGCTAPGSYVIGCRIPVGGARRDLVTVKCQGTIPAGFDGFPGAGGGGLGGGSAVPTDDNVTITQIRLIDNGQASGGGTTSIDVVSHQCEGEDTVTTGDDEFESLFDTLLQFEVTNDSTQSVTFTSLSFTVPEASGDGTSSYESPSISLSGSSTEVPGNGGAVTFNAIVFEVGTVNGKSFVGARSAIPADLGFRNITFRIRGRTSDGQQITVTRSIGVAFADYETCN